MLSRLVVKFWWNRLGDNIFQVIRALHVAIYLKKRELDIPRHKYFKTNQIVVTSSEETEGQIKGSFDNFKSYKCGHVEQSTLNKASKKNHETVYNLLRGLLNIQPSKIYSDNDLFLYMRSGDLFGNKCTNIEFKGTDQTLVGKVDDRPQPPLDFYVKVIESKSWENIYIICEDSSNPNVNELIKKYPKIIYNKQSLEKDIEMILGAVNVTHYNGNFIDTLYLFSDTLKTFYCFDHHFQNDYKKGYTSMRYNAGDYYKSMGKWKVSKEQLKLMITYKIPDIVEVK